MLDRHIEVTDPTDEEIETMSELMQAFIMPNELKTDDQKEAFKKAVVYQIAHEKTLASQAGEDALPQGVTRFTIGHFSATIDSEVSPVISRKTICPYAYSVLLRAGLIYRGLNGGDEVPWLSSVHFSGRL